jgi:hypothetical protein
LQQVNIFLTERLIPYIPNVFAAALILFIGVIVADYLSKFVLASAKTANLSSVNFFASIAKWAVWIATAFAAILGTLGVVSIVRQFKGLLKIFQGLSGASKNIAKFLGIGAKSSEKVLTATMKTTGKTVSGAAAESAVKAGSATAAKTVAKSGTKTLGKSLLKKIPIIGALAGIGFGLSRLADGDLLGAAGEVASGLAGTIPGAGTAASIGIDAALMARDVSKSSEVAPPKKMATGGIVTSPTRAIVGEAGTEAVIPLDKFYAKLDELIATVKQGGHVYLDGTKVGTAMNVSTYRVQ